MDKDCAWFVETGSVGWESVVDVLGCQLVPCVGKALQGAGGFQSWAGVPADATGSSRAVVLDQEQGVLQAEAVLLVDWLDCPCCQLPWACGQGMETEQLGDEPALVELVQALEYQETNYLKLLHLTLT